MDLRFLSLGKYDIIKPSNLNEKYNNSDCYFDWVSLEKVDYNPQISMARNIFNYSVSKENRDTLLKTYEPNIGQHMQETLMLVSQRDGNGFLDKVSHIYISMINLPMWNEDIISDEKTYVDLRKKVEIVIESCIDEQICRLYSSFDQCDYVLIADGTKVSFSQYTSIIKCIRQLAVTYDNIIKLPAVHDITTIYGYNENCLENCSDEDNEKLDLIVKLSLKSISYKKQFLSLFSRDNSLPHFMKYIDTIGRFDCMIFWEKISTSEVNAIADLIHEQSSNFFAYCINVGFESGTESDIITGYLEDNNKSLLSKHSQIKFDEWFYNLQEPPFDSQLLNALAEVYHSVNAMLKKGFAQYYTLTFYESFFSFIEYLNRVNTEYQNSEGNSSKIILEKIYDMYRTYFGFLNALTTCTIHSDRQFIQSDSYQLLYFDAPPKLIAFYTAIANKIVTYFNEDNSNKYTFLITPDFKKDIYVESLTKDKTIGQEHNILIIHINEESMYNVTSTIRIIIHEIFHHIGQSAELRRIRSQKFVKCCIAYIIAKNIKMEVLRAQQAENPYNVFSNLIDALYNKMFGENGESIFKNNNTVSTQAINGVLYYSEELIIEFLNTIRQFFRAEWLYLDNPITDVLKLRFKFVFPNDMLIFDDVTLDATDESVLQVFSSTQIANSIYYNIFTWLNENNHPKAYSQIQYAFREGFADACMLNLVSNDDIDRALIYTEMLHNTKAEEMEGEKPRIIAVLESLQIDDEINDWGNSYKSAALSEENQDTIALFNLYLKDSVLEYLKTIPSYVSFASNSTTNKCDIISCLNTLERGDSKAIIELMDKEIFEYRKRLLEK